MSKNSENLPVVNKKKIKKANEKEWSLEQKKKICREKISGEDSLKIKYVKIMKNKTPG